MNGISSANASPQLLDACRVLFPDALIQPVFLDQLHAQQLKSTYRSLAKEYHPDSCAGLPDTTRQADQFRRVTSAYELLTGYIRKRDSLPLQQAFWSKARHPAPASPFQRPHVHGTARPFRPRYSSGKPARNPDEQYYDGPLPTFPLKIGLYLYYRSAVSYQAVVRAIIWQRDMRPPFGELAAAWGWLDPYFVSVIRSATEIPGTFGERAVKLGLLSEAQVRVILTHQKMLQLPVGRYFVDRGLLREYELRAYLHEQNLHNRAVARSEPHPEDRKS